MSLLNINLITALKRIKMHQDVQFSGIKFQNFTPPLDAYGILPHSSEDRSFGPHTNVKRILY